MSDKVAVEVVRVRGGLVDGEGGRFGAWLGSWGGGRSGGRSEVRGGVFVAWEGLVRMRGGIEVDAEEVDGGCGLGRTSAGGTGGKITRGIRFCWFAGGGRG